jgi:hypothetical protein
MKKSTYEGINLLFQIILWPLLILVVMSQIAVYTNIPFPIPAFAEWLRHVHGFVTFYLLWTFIGWIVSKSRSSSESLKPQKPDKGNNGSVARVLS